MYDINQSIFLTFDVDWACDEVLEYVANTIENEKIATTFFVTHDTYVLKKLSNNPAIELGIHPNFNKFFTNDTTNKSPIDIIKYLKKVVPDAKSIRSHSLVQSASLLDIFVEEGFTHDVNLFIPANSNIELKPFYNWNGIIRAPYFWEDDVHCLDVKSGKEKEWDVSKFLNKPGLKIFNFHPIHFYLNTEDLQRYNSIKKYNKDIGQIDRFINKSEDGTKTFFYKLIEKAKLQGFNFAQIKEIMP